MLSKINDVLDDILLLQKWQASFRRPDVALLLLEVFSLYLDALKCVDLELTSAQRTLFNWRILSSSSMSAE